MTTTTRARAVGTVAALLLGLGAAGCGGDDDQQPKGSAASPSPSEGPTRTVGKPVEPGGEPTLGPKGEQTDVLGNLPGSTKPGCVRVGRKARDVRSGDMAAGPFDAARTEYVPTKAKKRRVSLYFIPTHTDGLKTIAVHGRQAGSGATFDETSDSVADAESFKYFAMELDLPRPGRWTISANTGRDNGCWIVDLD